MDCQGRKPDRRCSPPGRKRISISGMPAVSRCLAIRSGVIFWGVRRGWEARTFWKVRVSSSCPP